jgi:hypothetical protein
VLRQALWQAHAALSIWKAMNINALVGYTQSRSEAGSLLV